MLKPQIISYASEVGKHNEQLDNSIARIISGNTYKDCSTICITPSRGLMPARAVYSHISLMMPMNQKFFRMFPVGMEVGDAYSTTIDSILSHPELSTWKYILTIEDDNIPPTDGFLKLIESIEGGVNGIKYDAVGGLYWCKGLAGSPMIYGNINEIPKNFRPMIPVKDSIQECNGLGMGFTLFRLSMLKDEKLTNPLFKTLQGIVNGSSKAYTQDLYFFEQAGKLGYKFACDTRVLVGHYDINEDIVW